MREDHTDKGAPVNAIVAVDLVGSGSEPGRVLADGHDFVSSPRLSPDGRRLIWLAWDHPNMPWNGTILYLADLDEDGAVAGEPLAIAGGQAESIFQPEWSPDGAYIIFVSDRSGWWNLYRFELPTHASSPIAPMAAEFGQPQWVFGMSTYAFAGPDRIVCTYLQAGLGEAGVVDLATGTLQTVETPFTQFASVRAAGDRVVFVAGAPSLATCVVEFDLKSGQHRILKKATDILDQSARASPTISPRSKPWSFRLTVETPLSACSIRLTIPTTLVPRMKSRRCSSSAMAARPRPRRVRSTWVHTTGPAAASRCSM